MKRLMTSSMVIGLLFAAASCGSDKKTTATTTADSTAVTTAVSTAGSTATSDTTAASTATGGSTATAASVDTTGLSAEQAQALTISIQGAAAAGVTLDASCLKAVIAQLSDADAKLIVDAGPAGNPTLSAAGEALSPKAAACATSAG
ncbi:MAG: hypothetical protein JWM34_392 [Ilumatobacteraceae bacterium]|nr:hypothetical protein [Ilumatobacteraceae bacterium]